MRGTRGSSLTLIIRPTYTDSQVVESPSWAQVACCFSVQEPELGWSLEGTPEIPM